MFGGFVVILFYFVPGGVGCELLQVSSRLQLRSAFSASTCFQNAPAGAKRSRQSIRRTHDSRQSAAYGGKSASEANVGVELQEEEEEAQALPTCHVIYNQRRCQKCDDQRRWEALSALQPAALEASSEG